MTSVTVEADRFAALEENVTRLSEELAFLTAAARNDQERRDSLGELKDDLMPVAEGAMQIATRELETLRQDVDVAELVSLLRTLAVAAPTLQQSLVALQRLSELAEDASPLAGDAVAALTERMARAEELGYFDFTRAGIGVVDKVVASFDADDVEQLGDNIVTILNTVKDLTQPEMLAVVQRMVGALHRQQAAIEQEPHAAPGLVALLKRLRDPDVRRGIGRALDTLGSVTAETGPTALHEKAT